MDPHLARKPNVDGSFLLVSCAHPDLDSRKRKGSDGLWDAVLQLVLNGCCTKEEEVALNLGRRFQQQAQMVKKK